MSESGPALAHLIADYMTTLIERKLERQEALELALSYQAELLDGARERREGEEG